MRSEEVAVAGETSGWGKAPAELVERFMEILAEVPGATTRKMFGYPAAFANGYMFTSLFEDRWIIRLPPEAITELETLGGEAFSPMPGRRMRGYLAMPPSLVADRDGLQPWLDRALEHVLAMPPKKGT
jgi:TfoX/Sxy family transcriptional regulator of competence genes